MATAFPDFFWKIPLPLAFFGFGILLKFFVAVATLEQKVCGSQKQGGVENFFLSIFSIFLLGLVQNFCATVRLIPEKIEMSPHVWTRSPSSRKMTHEQRDFSPHLKIRGSSIPSSQNSRDFVPKKSHFWGPKIRRHSEKFSPMIEIFQKRVV